MYGMVVSHDTYHTYGMYLTYLTLLPYVRSTYVACHRRMGFTVSLHHLLSMTAKEEKNDADE